MAIYDNDRNAVSTVQKAVNGAGYKPPLTVNGIYDDATSAGIKWLQQTGGGTVDGHVSDELLNALGVDPTKQHFAAVDVVADVKAPPPPPPSKAKPIAILATIGAGIAIGATFGGPLGAAIGGAAGVVAGMVIGRA